MEYKNAALCVIGTELTQGIIQDKHCQLISSELVKLGIHINSMILINDDGSIETVLNKLVKENDIVLVTGGLGPTSDDMTRSCIANVANVKLYQNKDCFDALYKRVGDRIHGANGIQAMIPETFEYIENPFGTAPGFKGFVKDGNRDVIVIAMPGPPRELNPMFYERVLPWISLTIGKEEQERDEYSVFLVCESKLEELCQKNKVNNVKWGTRFQSLKISLFLSDGTKEDRDKMFNNLKEDIGETLIVKSNNSALDSLTNYLIENNETISCAESCTGGLIAKLLTDKSGSSKYFMGGVVSYANQAKMNILKVKESTLNKYGAVSSQTVIEMAEGVNNLLDTSLSVSTSGIAGPTGAVENKPVGTVWFGFASKNKEPQSICLHIINNGRDGIRRRAAVAAMLLAIEYQKGSRLLDIINKWEYI